jgi:hypothetical protein
MCGLSEHSIDIVSRCRSDHALDVEHETEPDRFIVGVQGGGQQQKNQ